MVTKKFWKLSKTQSKLLFAILGISAVAAPTGAIIYSVVHGPTYVIKDPWAGAIDLNPKLKNYFNEKLTKNKTTFKVGESSDIGIYVNKNDIKEINSLLRNGNEWIDELSQFEKQELLSGTNASFSEDGKLYFNGKEMREIALFPTILEYPYDGDDKFGEVSFQPSNKHSGLFKYSIRFCLRLGLIDTSGNNVDLKKDFDFSINYDQEIKLSELLTLMNNDSIKTFVSSYSINENKSNADILTGLLNSYYDLEQNQHMDFRSEITPVGSRLKSNSYSDKRANADTIHVKYNNRSIFSLDSFGANLFNKHIGDYDTIETIFNKIGIEMPKFENQNGFLKHDRKSGFNLEMKQSDVSSYKGYINYGDQNNENINDNVSDNGTRGTIFNSEHKVFTNNVLIKFLDINDGGEVRKPTTFYYDQQIFNRGNINYNNYQIESNIKNIINNIDYYNTTSSSLNSKLNAEKGNILNSIESTVRDSLSSNGVSQGVYNSTTLKSDFNLSITDRPRYGTRKDGDKVYFDKSLRPSSIDSSVALNTFNKDGEKMSSIDISRSHCINGRIIYDPNGVVKNELDSTFGGIYVDGNWDTNTSIYTVIDEVRNKVESKFSTWLNSSNNVLQDTNEGRNFNYEIKGPIKDGRFTEGNYSVKISAPNDVWNFKGNAVTKEFKIRKAPESEENQSIKK